MLQGRAPCGGAVARQAVAGRAVASSSRARCRAWARRRATELARAAGCMRTAVERARPAAAGDVGDRRLLRWLKARVVETARVHAQPLLSCCCAVADARAVQRALLGRGPG
eukprot:8621319-Lingulodinium_polyedra.AAC.1